MRISVTLKLIVIPVVVYATWRTTGSLMAQQSKTVAPAQATVGKVISVGKVAPDPAPHVLHPKEVSSISLEESSVEVQGNFIQVHASVSMLSRYKGGPSYLWRLTVTDLASDKVASDVPYLTQMFTMDPSGSMKPRFRDVVQLPSGKYGVNLTLHRIPENFTVEQLFNDEGSLATSASIRVLRKVVIQ